MTTLRSAQSLLVLPGLLLVPSVTAQDCSIGRDGWDDIQRFRVCIEENGLEAWNPWVLHQAAEYTSNPTIVRLLLQAGADPNAPDDNGLTPLHWGAENSNPMVVTHLLDSGADLSARDNDGYTALHWAAAQSGNGRVVKVLLDRGADPFAESNDGRTPLHSALRYRADPGVVSRMLDAGADEHLTPLQLSLLRGDVMAVDRMLAEGADPNSREDVAGWTPLHYAADLQGAGLLPIVSALLQAGADPGPTAQGFTPLHGVMRNPEVTVSVVDALLEAGADPMARDQDRDTPLHWAANSTDDVAIIEALLDSGADLRAENEAGSRPVDLAWDIRGSPAYWRLVVPEGVLVPGRNIQRQPQLVRRDLGRRLALRRVDRDRARGAACSHRYGVGRVDAYVRVLRSDGTQIATDDDTGSGSNARVEFRAPRVGEYLVIATSFEGGVGGHAK